MTYYQFIQAVEVKVKERIQENVTVSIHTAVKNNGTRRQGLNIVEQGINISPTIYLEEYYQQFQQDVYKRQPRCRRLPVRRFLRLLRLRGMAF